VQVRVSCIISYSVSSRDVSVSVSSVSSMTHTFTSASEVEPYRAIDTLSFNWFYFDFILFFVFFVRILKPAAGSAPSLPSYSYRMSQAAQFTRPRASPPPAVCRQTSAGGASPNTRRCSMTVQGLGVTRQQTQLADGRIGRAPSTPAFCGLQPSSGSPVMKVIHTRLLTLGFGSFCLSRRLFSQLQ